MAAGGREGSGGRSWLLCVCVCVLRAREGKRTKPKKRKKQNTELKNEERREGRLRGLKEKATEERAPPRPVSGCGAAAQWRELEID